MHIRPSPRQSTSSPADGYGDRQNCGFPSRATMPTTKLPPIDKLIHRFCSRRRAFSLHPPRRRRDDAGQAGRTRANSASDAVNRIDWTLKAEHRAGCSTSPATDRPAQSASGVPHPDGRRAAAVAPVPRHGRFGRDRLYFWANTPTAMRGKRYWWPTTATAIRPNSGFPKRADRGLPRRPDRSRQPRASLRRSSAWPPPRRAIAYCE